MNFIKEEFFHRKGDKVSYIIKMHNDHKIIISNRLPEGEDSLEILLKTRKQAFDELKDLQDFYYSVMTKGFPYKTNNFEVEIDDE